jgi:hypothetical protein
MKQRRKKPYKKGVAIHLASSLALLPRGTQVDTYDEAALWLLLEISLLDSAYQRSGASDDFLTDAAKRYRVDVEKVQKAVAAEFAAKRERSKAKGKALA